MPLLHQHDATSVLQSVSNVNMQSATSGNECVHGTVVRVSLLVISCLVRPLRLMAH